MTFSVPRQHETQPHYNVLIGCHHPRPHIFRFVYIHLGKLLTETFALICSSVHIDFGTDHVAEGHEHLGELGVTKLLGEVVDEQVAAVRACHDS